MIILKGGATVEIIGKRGTCKSCGAVFEWAMTKGGGLMPVVQVDGEFVSHFANCPGAAKHRKNTMKNTVPQYGEKDTER